jgi:glucan-binding YG repeat protein
MANLLSNTTIGGYQSIHTGNIGSYAITSLSGYATQSWVQSQGYVTGSYLPTSGGALTGGLYINNADPTIFLQDTNHRSAMIHVNSNVFYVLRGTGNNSTGWTTYNGYWPLELNLENNNALFGGSVSAPAGDFRAPIFFDSADTAYYVDPNGSSNLYNLVLSGAKQTYLNINPGNGYEAMVLYNGGSGSGWYVGKRMASQLVGTESFHFYSVAASQTVAGIDTGGNFYTTGSLTIAGTNLTGTQTQQLKNTLGVTSLPYSCDITVNGDANTFYAVQFWGGDQDVWRRIIIKRGYSEPAPWDPIGTGVHHGGLLLDWEGNFGGWGGAEYADRIRVFNESYTNVCADMFIYSHSMGYVFMLRGGGALYHLHSDQPINGFYQSGAPDILYSTSTLSYDDTWSGTNQYDVPAPAPLSLAQVNSSRIDGLRTKKQSLFDARYVRQGVDISGVTNISSTNFLASNAFYLNGTSYYLNSTNGGIYTNARFETAGQLHVGGNAYLAGT